MNFRMLFNTCLVVVLLLVTTSLKVRKPQIPELVEASEKIPVIFNAFSKTTLINLRVFSQLPGEKYDSTPISLDEDVLETYGALIVDLLNDAFDTDKFYYMSIEDIPHKKTVFLGEEVEVDGYEWKLMGIDFLVLPDLNVTYEKDYHEVKKRNYAQVVKSVGIRFVTTRENGRVKGVGKSLGYNVVYERGKKFDVDPNSLISIDNLASIHDYAPYMEELKKDIETGIPEVVEEIMEKYRK